MTQAVTVYRWDDEGAPQITEGRPSEFLTVLKKCLVEGYGTKTAAGWAVADEITGETPYLALKNNITAGGSGGVLMMSSSNDNMANKIRIQSALDYISQSSNDRLGPYFYTSTGGTTDSYPNNWVILATATAFYYFAHSIRRATYNYFDNASHSMFFAGDIKSFYPNDPAKFITLSGALNSNSTGWNSQLNYILGVAYSSKVGYVYRLDSVNARADAYLSTSLGSYRLGPSSVRDSLPSIRVLSPFILTTGSYQLGNAGTHGNSETLPFARGIIPGLFASQETGYRSESMPFIKEIDSVNYLSIPDAASNGTSTWINMEDWT